MIKRLIFDHIQQRLFKNKVILLFGPRQVGKTTLAKYLQSVANRESIYLDLESAEDLNKLSDAENYLQARSDRLIIIDEVQRMPEIFPVLRAVIDRNRSNGRFILLGSASPDLLVKSAETLAGRIAYIEINPFNYKEVSDVVSWKRLWLHGGYPDFLLQGDEFVSYTNRVDFIRTYIERDLPMLGMSASAANLSKKIATMCGSTQLQTILGMQRCWRRAASWCGRTASMAIR